MFRPGDTVEEIATGRRGTVANSSAITGQMDRVMVHFTDGVEPLIKDFKETIGLRLVETARSTGGDEAPYSLPASPDGSRRGWRDANSEVDADA